MAMDSMQGHVVCGHQALDPGDLVDLVHMDSLEAILAMATVMAMASHHVVQEYFKYINE